jgi:hypothetical protein
MGMKDTNGVTMVFGIHRAEEIGGGFVLGLLLPAPPSGGLPNLGSARKRFSLPLELKLFSRRPLVA